MTRILVLGEAVTLAHVARCLVLGDSLMPEHDVTFAFAPEAHRYVPPKGHRLENLASIPSAQFVDALRRGRPIYDESTLERYVEDDLRLIDKVRPDLIVGDFRISLSVSARLRNVPSVAVSNAYWSPWYTRPPPLPTLPWTRWVPLPLSQGIFTLVRRPVMAAHAQPLNRVRVRYGLPRLVCDLPHVYNDADYVAYADVPELFPTPGAPATHRHIGPILWSPHVPTPAWCTTRRTTSTAYVTMGSSGNPRLLDSIVAALDALGIEAWVATAGAHFEPRPGSLAQVAPYLPGTEAARHADLVVCNGGSLTTQQALAAGKPVLGIPSNMDQFLNMRPIVEGGAGLSVRADRVSTNAIRSAAGVLLARPKYAYQARRLSAVLARHSAPHCFRTMVNGILGAGFGEHSNHEKDQPLADPELRPVVHDSVCAGLG